MSKKKNKLLYSVDPNGKVVLSEEIFQDPYYATNSDWTDDGKKHFVSNKAEQEALLNRCRRCQFLKPDWEVDVFLGVHIVCLAQNRFFTFSSKHDLKDCRVCRKFIQKGQQSLFIDKFVVEGIESHNEWVC